ARRRAAADRRLVRARRAIRRPGAGGRATAGAQRQCQCADARSRQLRVLRRLQCPYLPGRDRAVRRSLGLSKPQSVASAGVGAAAPNRGRILAGLMAMMMLAAMDTTIVSTAIPQIVGDLGG